MRKIAYFILLFAVNFLHAQPSSDPVRSSEEYFTMIRDADKTIASNPKNENALYIRAKALDQIGDDKSAVIDYTKLIQINPKKADYFLGRCSANFDLKNFTQIVSDANAAIALDPKSYDAYVFRGDAYDVDEKWELSVADFEKAIALKPSADYAYMELATNCVLRDKYLDAIAVLDRLLVVNPKLQNSFIYRSDCKMKLHDYKGAIEDCDKAIALDPENFIFVYFKVLAQDAAGDPEAACENAKKAWSLLKETISPEAVVCQNFIFTQCTSSIPEKILKVRALNTEALKLMETDNYVGIIKKYDQMIALVPDSAMLYYDRGKMKRALNDHENAVIDYKKSIALNPNIKEAHTALGVSLIYLQQFDEGEQAFLTGIKNSPETAMNYHNLGLIYGEKKEYTKAIRQIELAVKKDPKYTDAYLSLGSIYLLTGDKQRACYYFKRAYLLGSMEARVKMLSECN
jgi:tetratricopeptide (TPR) repeat protein